MLTITDDVLNGLHFEQVRVGDGIEIASGRRLWFSFLKSEGEIAALRSASRPTIIVRFIASRIQTAMDIIILGMQRSLTR